MDSTRRAGGFSALQQFVRPQAADAGLEVCDFCHVAITEEHGHVADLQARGIMCACRACYLLFTNEGAGKGRYRSIPARYVCLTGFVLTRRQWLAWQIPVDVAFIFMQSDIGRPVAFYPSPGGAVESTLPLDALRGVMTSSPALAGLEPDVEALLVRFQASVSECFIVPIDRCYQLIGELRLLWQGFDGGEAVHEHLDAFFASIRASSQSGTSSC